jgi:hypothetical protein
MLRFSFLGGNLNCDFSEFSYGYASIREAEAALAAVYHEAGAPTLPSLQQEESLGYDAKLPFVEYALLLQFKRTEYVSRRHPNSPTWDAVGGPHYRFSIDTDNHQHDALVGAEQDFTTALDVGEVLYVAPHFHRLTDFDTNYLGGTVLDNSVLIVPSEFGVGVGVHHHVFDEYGVSQVLSDPHPPNREMSWQGVTRQVREHLARRDTSMQRHNIRELESTLQSAVERTGRYAGRGNDAPIGQRLYRLAALLGCGLAVVAAPGDS